MKTILVVMVALMMAAGVSHAYDGNITVDGKNTNTNTATSTSNANSYANGGASTVYNNNSPHYLGQIPQAIPEGTLQPSIPMAAGEYGYQATEYSLRDSIFYNPQMNYSGYIHAIGEVNRGKYSWEEIKEHITVNSYLSSSVAGGLPQTENVEYFSADRYAEVSAKYNMLGYSLVSMGPVDITAEYTKEDMVKPDHLKFIAQEISMAKGLKVVMLADQFKKGYFVPDGFHWNLDGFFTLIGNCLRAAGGLNGGVGGQSSKNTKVFVPGARFVFFRLVPCQTPPPPPVVVASPPPPAPKVCNPAMYLEEIRRAEAEIAICFRYSHNNLYWRVVAGTYCYKAYLCTGRKEYLYAAINHFEMAELNSIHGFDIREFADSRDLIAKTEYYLASAFYERDGSIDNFWIAPKAVVHEDKKRHTDKPVALSKSEKVQVLKVRATLEKYSKKLILEEVDPK